MLNVLCNLVLNEAVQFINDLLEHNEKYLYTNGMARCSVN